MNARGRVLLVDDDANILLTLHALLTDELDIEIAGDIATAYRALDASTFGLVACDFRLAGGNGLDVLRYARKRDPHVLGIVWTGREELVEARTQADDFRVILKTESPEFVLQVVRQSVAIAALRQSTRELRL
ncbi:MAG: response regulator [Deltaproteobacteria bacterium]|nr:response regulator [Deltaproteobacteria bacterium]